MRRHESSVLVIDAASLGGSDGGMDLSRLVRLNPPPSIAIDALSDREPYVFAALQLGACGVVLREWPVAERAGALLELHEGGVALTPHLAGLVMLALARPVVAGSSDGAYRPAAELAVMGLVRDGFSVTSIARTMRMPLSVVRGHLRGALRRLRDDGLGGDRLLHSGVPRLPSPGLLGAAAEAIPEHQLR